jgi:hypothetical protein
MNNTSRWEQRDLLSHSINLSVTKAEELLINAIVTNLINKTDYSWDRTSLSLTAEANLQQTLRLQGYGLQCYNLNILPSSIRELSQYIVDYSLQVQIIANLKFIKNYSYLILMYIYVQLRRIIFSISTNILGIGSTILIVAMLLWLRNVDYLWYSLGIGYVLSNCMTIVIHEYWVHQQLRPKNRIVGFIFDYIGHLLVSDRISWGYAHLYHHTHWKSPQDIEVTAMLSNSWIYYLMGASPVHGNIAHASSIEARRESETNRLLPESKFLQKYVVEITIITHLILLLICGLTVYVYFVLFQIWLFHKYIIGFNELVTHYNNKTQEEEVDIPYLFPICCGTAYHKSHHALSDSIILGPGKLKYFNIQYYFVKLFYNITAKVPASYTGKDNHV